MQLSIYIIDDMGNMKSFVTCIKCILFFTLLFTRACIKRNNPWDPVNGCPNDYRIEIRQKTIPNLQKFVSDAQNNYLMLEKRLRIIDSLNAKNDSARTLFVKMQKKLDSTYQINSIIDSTNRIDCKTMIPKLKADTFPSFTFITDTINILNFKSSITEDSLKSITKITESDFNFMHSGIN
ncbi:MAG TPA: hypothetical protein VHO70_12755 [Chitinispirillaceae bacterium]|nr:hypothetical protein [Chitinispirillaceae bacterium]